MVAQDPDATSLRGWLVETISSITGIQADLIDTAAPFHDFGVSSTDAVDIAGRLEELLDIDLPPTLLYERPCIDDVVAALTRQHPQNPAADPSTELGTPVSAPLPPAIGVIGLACRFPGSADSPDTFWHNLVTGVDGARPLPTDRWPDTGTIDRELFDEGWSRDRVGAFLDDIAGFDTDLFGIPPGEARRIDPQQRLVLEVARTALEDAAIAPGSLRGSRTGVFIGISGSGEYSRLQTDVEGDSCFQDPYFGYGSAPSVAAGRLSYLLDLAGPSMCIDTACSSSLLAVHLAVRSLRDGECDLAIVAGVSVIGHPAVLVQGRRAHQLAPDGRSKAFDATADGFLIGEGCGAVILERLDDALVAARRIHAVIRASAVNSDGRSNGITAPSKDAQVDVISAALRSAGIGPEQVGFVESHGSGTLLGDAVEMAGLLEVFGNGALRTAPLVVGAVKTSIGHLVASAGIAGFIKAVLATREGLIPPNLHLVRPNAAVSAAADLITLPAKAVDFPTAADGRRRAGVSSFGWSGTNVHVVLEQAPPAPPPTCGAPWQLLTLGARTPTALHREASSLADHLDAHPDLELADVAATLQRGRDALEHRAALVCRDLREARSALRAVDPTDSPVSGGPARVVFLFPGTGDHYPGMGAELYATMPAYRAAVDDCAGHLLPHLGTDVRDYLTRPRPPAPDATSLRTIRSDNSHRNGAVVGDEPVALTHAAVFTVEYALARLWRACGIHPDAVLGYSLGELAAACAAGVFSLPDAASLVAHRARLIASGPTGAMIAVALPVEQVEPDLPPGVSVAAICGPAMTVVSGPVEQATALARAWIRAGIACRRIPGDHPMHTAALEPAGAKLAGLVAATTRQAPTVPFVSTLSGDWLSDDEAVDPAYWARQLSRPVRFSTAVATVADGARTTWVELGPGQTLTGLVRQLTPAGSGSAVLPVLPVPATTGTERRAVITAIGRHWSRGGAEVDPAALHDPWPRPAISLPTYPFEHRRFWPEPRRSAALPHGSATSIRVATVPPQDPRTDDPPPASGRDIGTWFSAPVWHQAHPLPPATDTPSPVWLVLSDGSPLPEHLANRLRRNGTEVIIARCADHAGAVDDGALRIDPDDPDGMDRLVAKILAAGPLPTRMLHALAAAPLPSADPLRRLQIAQRRGVLGILELARAVTGRAPDAQVTVWSLTSGVHGVVGDDDTDPEKATVLGLCGTLGRELPNLRFRTVDVPTHPRVPGSATVDAVLRELLATDADERVAIRGGRRWLQRIERVPVPDTDTAAPPVWRPHGSYLITGGLTGVGLSLARCIATAGHVRLALVGRTVLPPRDTWSDLDAHDDPVRRRILAVRDLERLGAQVLTIGADVADPAQARHAVDLAMSSFGEVNGVIHAAGLPASGLLQLTTTADAERVLRPKVTGAVTLRECLSEAGLDFFALCSSALVNLGGVGETDYCAANAFLDAYAQHHRTRGMPIISIGWGPWRSDSWHAGAHPAVDELRRQHGIVADEGFAALTRALRSPLAHLLAVPFDLDALRDRWSGLLDEITGRGQAGEAFPRPTLRTAFVAPRTELERDICDIWSSHLGVRPIGLDDQLFELGGNSLIGLTIIGEIGRLTGVTLTAADLFESPTPGGMAALVSRAGTPEPASPDSAGPESTGRGERRRQLAGTAAGRRARRERRGAQ